MFLKPGSLTAPSSSVDRTGGKELDDIVITSAEDRNFLSIKQQRQKLPIFKNRDHLLYAIEKHRVVLIVGETGSGKTTQIPQYLHEAGWTADGSIVGCTQPRRIAATSVAERVAEEMGVQLGQEVGYNVRFDERYDDRLTKIKYLTDGMLLRETLVDPLLSRYSVIMVDEAHERSINTDILIGLIKKIMKRRDLKVIISSATMDCENFLKYFTTNEDSPDFCTIVSVEGRMFPVDIQYLKDPCGDYINAAVEAVLKIHKYEDPGDVLVFLTGKEEVDTAVSLIHEALDNSKSLQALPMFGGLSLEEQREAFLPAPKGVRKVIVATNIAEASITFEGIVFVVDSGFVKIRAYNPTTGMESLVVTAISKASAMQRAGRAGRTKPGKAFRLYPEAAFRKMLDNSIPELQRSNLAPILLQLKALGIDNVLRFDYVSPPSSSMVTRALELLYSLKAFDDYGRLSMPFGTQLAELPVDPWLGSMLLNAALFKCGQEILTIAAMLSVQNVFITGGSRRDLENEKRKFAVEEGDHITYLNVFNAFMTNRMSSKWARSRCLNYQSLLRAVSIRKQLQKHLKRLKYDFVSCQGDTVAIRKCVTSGYFGNAAKLQPDGSYRAIRGSTPLYMHPNSVLAERSPAWVVFTEVVETTKAYMRDVIVCDPDWLVELAPHYYTK